MFALETKGSIECWPPAQAVGHRSHRSRCARGCVLQYSRNEVGRGGGIVPPNAPNEALYTATPDLLVTATSLTVSTPELAHRLVCRPRYPVRNGIFELCHINTCLFDFDE